MHYFELRNIQHFLCYLFPAFVSVFLIAAALAYSHFRTRGSDEDKKGFYHAYPDGIVDEKGPFPLVLILVIAGTIIWAFFYILFIGLLEVKI
jgi:hypothetical protein